MLRFRRAADQLTGASPYIVMSDSTPTRLAARRPFVIDAARTTILVDAADYRAEFRIIPALLLEGIFDPPLLDRLLTRAGTSQFMPNHVADVGYREVADDRSIAAVLSVLLGRPTLARWLETVAGVPPLRGVAGAFAQSQAGAVNGLTWHDDRIDPLRALGVVVNLSREPYEGGTFEMRTKGASRPMLVHHHDKPGMTLIFAVRPDLEHRVTPVTVGGPRQVFAGWFLKA